jgi:hypothetical protein
VCSVSTRRLLVRSLVRHAVGIQLLPIM